MLQAEYGTHVTRCAQAALGASAGAKLAAKASCSNLLSGLRQSLLPNIAACVDVLLWSTHAKTATGLVRDIYDIAWIAHVADVQAKIDTLP